MVTTEIFIFSEKVLDIVSAKVKLSVDKEEIMIIKERFDSCGFVRPDRWRIIEGVREMSLVADVLKASVKRFGKIHKSGMIREDAFTLLVWGEISDGEFCCKIDLSNFRRFYTIVSGKAVGGDRRRKNAEKK